MGDAFSHIPPCPFHGIKLGAVGGQIYQLQLRMGGKPGRQQAGMVEGNIIDNQKDGGVVTVGIKHFFKMLYEALTIAPLMKGDGDLAGKRVQRSHAGFTLAPALDPPDARLVAPVAPPIAKSGAVGQGKLILKKQNGILGSLQEFFFMSRLNCSWRAGSASGYWPLAFCQLKPSFFRIV